MRLELDALEQSGRSSAYAAIDVDGGHRRAACSQRAFWIIEDDIRDKERAKDFDAEFIRLARAVYVENDQRAAIKRRLNLKLGSSLVEEKSYADYKS